ncbi:hypothetical protein RQP46_002180 [Phenoliferia psychrophenolica]
MSLFLSLFASLRHTSPSRAESDASSVHSTSSCSSAALSLLSISSATSHTSAPTTAVSYESELGVVSPPSLAAKMRAVLPPSPSPAATTAAPKSWFDGDESPASRCPDHANMHLRHTLRSFLPLSRRSELDAATATLGASCSCASWPELEEPTVAEDEPFTPSSFQWEDMTEADEERMARQMRATHDDSKPSAVWRRTGRDQLWTKPSLAQRLNRALGQVGHLN